MDSKRGVKGVQRGSVCGGGSPLASNHALWKESRPATRARSPPSADTREAAAARHANDSGRSAGRCERCSDGDSPSVKRARPPVGWHSTALQLPHSTTVWLWLNTVVMLKHPCGCGRATRRGERPERRQHVCTRGHGTVKKTPTACRGRRRRGARPSAGRRSQRHAPRTTVRRAPLTHAPGAVAPLPPNPDDGTTRLSAFFESNEKRRKRKVFSFDGGLKENKPRGKGGPALCRRRRPAPDTRCRRRRQMRGSLRREKPSKAPPPDRRSPPSRQTHTSPGETREAGNSETGTPRPDGRCVPEKGDGQYTRPGAAPPP